jgi:ribosomal silencing factor RsfS
MQRETVVIQVHQRMDKSVYHLEQLWDLLLPIRVILVMTSLEKH